MLTRSEDPGNYLMTVQGDIYYIWKVAEQSKTMKCMIHWSDFAWIEKTFLKLERENLCDIQPGHDGFYACLEHTTLLGSEIEIIPRSHYLLSDDSEKWIVDLKIPTGSETCTFYVFGKKRVGWMARHARFDEPLTLQLHKFNYEAVT